MEKICGVDELEVTSLSKIGPAQRKDCNEKMDGAEMCEELIR
jgi:hypothetical protein